MRGNETLRCATARRAEETLLRVRLSPLLGTRVERVSRMAAAEEREAESLWARVRWMQQRWIGVEARLVGVHVPDTMWV